MKHFEFIDDIKKADIDTLMQVPSMNKAAAEKVYEFFGNKSEI